MMKSIYALHDTKQGGEVVFMGDSKECASFAKTSYQNVSNCCRHGFLLVRRYKVESIKTVPREFIGNIQGKPLLKERYSIVNAVMMRDVARMRNAVSTGMKVKVFTEIDETNEKIIIGVFPITEKYRHVFSVKMGKYMQSYSWIELYRKDGVELVRERE